MLRLQVIVKALNKRSRLPAQWPDNEGIAGVVLEGFSFIGEEVNPAEIPNSTTGKWYRDRDGYFYLSDGLLTIDSTLAIGIVPPSTAVPGWISGLGLNQIWTITQGEDVKIAVLDSGYNINTTDLSEAVSDSKVFFSSVAGNPVTINDTYGHGSHCASLIGGRNKVLVTSCAPQSNLYIAKICSQGSVSSFKIIVDAIQWAIEKKVDIISISYGGERPDAELESIIKSAVHDHNIVVIASIGDKLPGSANLPCFPALFKDCIAVGATDDRGQMAIVTIINGKTEINAPGQDIPGYILSGKPGRMTGTSQASAIVAGICALIISRFKKTGKMYTVESIRDLLTRHADPVAGNSSQKLIAPLKIFQAI
jgi:subtilisin